MWVSFLYTDIIIAVTKIILKGFISLVGKYQHRPNIGIKSYGETICMKDMFIFVYNYV